MVVADQHNSGPADRRSYLRRAPHPFVGAVGIAEVAEVLASNGGIVGANLAFHAGQGVKLRRAPPRS